MLICIYMCTGAYKMCLSTLTKNKLSPKKFNSRNISAPKRNTVFGFRSAHFRSAHLWTGFNSVRHRSRRIPYCKLLSTWYQISRPDLHLHLFHRYDSDRDRAPPQSANNKNGLSPHNLLLSLLTDPHIRCCRLHSTTKAIWI